MKREKEPLDLLDEVKIKFGMDSDVMLAATAGISPAMLAHVRAGRRPLPLLARIRLLDKLSYEFSRAGLLKLLPDEVSAVIIESDNRRLRDRMDKKAQKNSTK